jgi:hypothetical protein
LAVSAAEAGVGIGARHAGLPGPDPGMSCDTAPDAKVEIAGHPTALWSLPVNRDCAAFVGEAKGLWLWAIICPAAAGVLMYDALSLEDMRDGYAEAELAFGSVSPLLSALPHAS